MWNAPWSELCSNSPFRRKNSSPFQMCRVYMFLFYSLVLSSFAIYINTSNIRESFFSTFGVTLGSFVTPYAMNLCVLFWMRKTVCGDWRVGRQSIVYSLFLQLPELLHIYLGLWPIDLENHIIRTTAIF